MPRRSQGYSNSSHQHQHQYQQHNPSSLRSKSTTTIWEEKTDYVTGETYFYNVLTSERRKSMLEGQVEPGDFQKPTTTSTQPQKTSNGSDSGGAFIIDTSLGSRTTAPTYASSSRTGGSGQTYAYYEKKKQQNNKIRNNQNYYDEEEEDDDIDEDSDEFLASLGSSFYTTSESEQDEYNEYNEYNEQKQDNNNNYDTQRQRSKTRSKSLKRHRQRRKDTSATKKDKGRKKSSHQSKRRHRRKEEDMDDGSSSSSSYSSGSRSSDDEEDDGMIQENHRYGTRGKRKHRHRSKSTKDRSTAKQEKTKKQEQQQQQKYKLTEKKGKEVKDTTTSAKSKSAISSSATALAMQKIEEQRKALEQKKQQLKAKEKAMEKERKAMDKQRKLEEEARLLREALEEQERKEKLEEERKFLESQLKSQNIESSKEYERRAKKLAQAADDARRKAEEEADDARRHAAELETARRKAEKEVEKVKKKAFKEEKEKLKALQEAETARLAAESQLLEQKEKLEQSQAQIAESASMLKKAQRQALREEQKRQDAFLHRQELQEELEKSRADLVASKQALEDEDEDSSSEDLSSSSESSSEYDDSKKHESMEQSLELDDIMKETEQKKKPKKIKARDKKRQLEAKYAASTLNDTNTTQNTSGIGQRSGHSTSYGDSFSSSPRRGTRPKYETTPSGRQAIMVRQASRPGMGSRQDSGKGGRGMGRGGRSGRGLGRGMSARGMPRQASARPGMNRYPSNRSGRGMGARGMSGRMDYNQSRMNMSRSNSRQSMNASYAMYEDEYFDPEESRLRPEYDRQPTFKKKKKKEDKFERPPRSLVIIWLVVAGELGFDLGTTVIAFRSLLEEDDCCGSPITLGPIPVTVTAPFFLLVSAELALLIRAILLTLIPSVFAARDDSERYDDDGKLIVQSTFMKYFCCFLRWKVNIIMRFLGILVLLNPFFGCVIAWVLLYQSDRKEAFMVLGFEAGSLSLHYLSVFLEGAITNCWEFLIHGLVPLVPFSAAVGLTLFYIKQGGVCYKDSTFSFNGCEVCIDGYPPMNGTCFLQNGTTYEFEQENVLDFTALNSVDDITGRSRQVSYCSSDNPGGPEENFCFFDWEDGKLDGTVINATEAPTLVPIISNSRCGATISPGARESQCRRLVWNPSSDSSVHCRTAGGPGDPCQLSIANDGMNEGRFKDPSGCTQEMNSERFISYGDTFFLWDEPDMFDKDLQWAGNAWLAYSTARFSEEITTLREEGIQIASSSVRYLNDTQFRAGFDDFFDACQPNCVTVGDISYVDILAATVFCDRDELCSTTVEAATAAMKEVSAAYDNRPFYVTSFGMLGTQSPVRLSQTMSAGVGFFVDEDSPVERVYWYTGEREDETNLAFQAAEGSESSLGEFWSRTCRNFN